MPSSHGSRLRGPREMSRQPKQGNVPHATYAPDFGFSQQQQQRPQESEVSSHISSRHRIAQSGLHCSTSQAVAHNRTSAVYESESEYSPPSMTCSSGSARSSRMASQYSASDNDADADATPIPVAVKTMNGSPARIRTKDACTDGRRVADGKIKMSMSNVRARVAKYEQRRRADPYASEGCLMP